MHAKLPGFVGCCGNHSTLVALSADDHGFSFELGIEQLFHGDEEGVHIDVEDRSLESAHETAAIHFTREQLCQNRWRRDSSSHSQQEAVGPSIGRYSGDGKAGRRPIRRGFSYHGGKRSVVWPGREYDISAAAKGPRGKAEAGRNDRS